MKSFKKPRIVTLVQRNGKKVHLYQLLSVGEGVQMYYDICGSRESKPLSAWLSLYNPKKIIVHTKANRKTIFLRTEEYIFPQGEGVLYYHAIWYDPNVEGESPLFSMETWEQENKKNISPKKFSWEEYPKFLTVEKINRKKEKFFLWGETTPWKGRRKKNYCGTCMNSFFSLEEITHPNDGEIAIVTYA